ncbi:nesprin-1 [Colossoma macropomum]|uniref:nesprin-1 n=1 Tax=Colossoma macropomum TaxID=42526 RepID=UPI001864ADC8|nr:nesprin-1 [Colossoma macropomum]
MQGPSLHRLSKPVTGNADGPQAPLLSEKQYHCLRFSTPVPRDSVQWLNVFRWGEFTVELYLQTLRNDRHFSRGKRLSIPGVEVAEVTLGDASMPGETALKASRHGNTQLLKPGTGLYLQPTEALYLDRDRLAQDDTKEDSKEWMSLADLSRDDSSCLEGCVQLERRWMLWHEFMKEYSSLDDWLQSAEKLAASPNSSHVLYITAKEELQKFESLRTEARLRLAQLDSLSQRSRILLGLFRGAMRTRLVEMTKECGRRWDQLSTTVDSVCRRLKHFVLQREDFERQREEMAVWLADMDLRLTEVEHFSERNTCAKMRQLQGFQQAVAESACRLNALLEQGEELIQRSEPADAQSIESQLQELLLYCARVFQGLGRLHTRLLSMRLVFEEDWPLCPDSGCPSETVLEEDAVVDHSTSPPAQNSTAQLCHEHLVLEWDPSVDIGGSISHDDADSSYFSASAGVCSAEELLTKDPLRRRAYLSPADSRKAQTCVQQPVTERSLEGVAPPRAPVPDAGRLQYDGLWKTSTPDSHSPEPVTFDPERISAWLGQTHRLCSKAVQTELAPQQCSSFTSSPSTQEEERRRRWGEWSIWRMCSPRGPPTHCKHKTCVPLSQVTFHLTPAAVIQTHSLELKTRCLKRPCSSDSEEDSSRNKTHRGQVVSADRCGPWSQRSFKLMDVLRAPALLYVLLALLLVVVIWPPAVLQDNQCHRSNSLERSFHFALRYVNGPPPT